MATKREKLFDCTYSSGSDEIENRVSAWTPEAAEATFRESLATAGIRGPGTIRVRTLRGLVAREHRLEALAS